MHTRTELEARIIIDFRNQHSHRGNVVTMYKPLISSRTILSAQPIDNND